MRQPLRPAPRSCVNPAWTTKASTSRNGQRSARSPGRSAAQARHCGAGYGSTNVTRAYALAQHGRARRVKRSSARTGSCGERTRSCGWPVLFLPRRSSTAGSNHDRIYRRASGTPRGRADLRGAAGRPVSVCHADAARRADPGKMPARAQRDSTLTAEIEGVCEANLRVYGAERSGNSCAGKGPRSLAAP